MKKKLLITGSGGLIGSAMVEYFCTQFDEVHGIDNNMREEFFGPNGDTTSTQKRLKETYKNFIPHLIDIRDKEIESLFKEHHFSAIVHCAAQPSHDLAAKIPILDFSVNANGTLNLLESMRQHCSDATFVYLSTNKVYGDQPNLLPLIELKTRYEYKNLIDQSGVKESMSIDQCVHSLFGVSKIAADLLVQEYGRNFGLNTSCLRGGCLTGPQHKGVELHGFLSYLVKANTQKIPYTIFGYKGKQVRDNIHSLDVAKLVEQIFIKPNKGEVFNVGGGKSNSCSMIEAMHMIEELSGIKMDSSYSEQARVGDHICYYSDLNKIKKHYPSWDISVPLDKIFEEIYLQSIKKLV
ncbi:MAG: NAD-dependent epimerase [Candidatus Cloacimonadota bacterium]|nr:MAG: NAD-dependent epimerase [Candidatus Cloacimonadota bacterium]PCJ21020.1 MAG: NAD-dependent epimerase [Candidatus Cloacimonadota bacterium]